MKYDLIIFGGGTAGIASAYIASKYGLNTLLVEKADVLGGSITRGLVLPCMKVNSQDINTEFITDLKAFADKYSARHKYMDGNEHWFNPELLKIVFDEMLTNVKCNVLFSTEPVRVVYKSINPSFEVTLVHKLLSLYTDTNYIVDATADGKIFQLLNCEFQPQSENTQAATLRFIMTNIDCKKFSQWLKEIDSNTDVTTIDNANTQIYLSTAYTWDDSKNWALKPVFEAAVKDGVLKYSDTAYFQLFSVPGMPDALAFNCPRIILEDDENLNDPFVYSRALRQGRERIYRIGKFCIKYLPGFEKAYISHIADMLGIRESYRIKGKYTVTADDIRSPKKFDNIAFATDYPIDIHTNKPEKDKLEYIGEPCLIPVEALISNEFDNLYAAGRNISADFDAHSAIRTQINCFSMGEAASKDIYYKIKSNLNKKQ